MKKQNALLLTVGFLVFVLWMNTGWSIETNLLWKKDFDVRVAFMMDAALDTGEIICAHGFTEERTQVTVWNGQGKFVWNRESPKGKCIDWVCISPDGQYYGFREINSREIKIRTQKAEQISYIWYGKEKPVEIGNFSSPLIFRFLKDGKHIFESPRGEGFGNAVYRESNGKILWKTDKWNIDEPQVFFSADGNYILACSGDTAQLFDAKEIKIVNEMYATYVNSISENGTYIGSKRKGIVDRESRVLLSGNCTISGDAKTAVQITDGKIIVYDFPSNKIRNEHDLIPRNWEQFPMLRLSYNGRICVLYGKKAGQKTEEINFYVIDTKTGEVSIIPGVGDALQRFFLSNNGEFFIIDNGSSILYYGIKTQQDKN